MSFKSLLLIIPFCVALGTLTGCGGSSGGLATEKGEMTIEEYEQLQQQEAQELAQDPNATAE